MGTLSLLLASLIMTLPQLIYFLYHFLIKKRKLNSFSPFIEYSVIIFLCIGAGILWLYLGFIIYTFIN